MAIENEVQVEAKADLSNMQKDMIFEPTNGFNKKGLGRSSTCTKRYLQMMLDFMLIRTSLRLARWTWMT